MPAGRKPEEGAPRSSWLRVRLTEHTSSQIDAMSLRHHKTRSDIVREAIAEKLAREAT